ncbi:hypothetical protein HID58_037985 [Brassica napus]|uniref:Uncharacterized protein n=1 Tax=Brassica napus TaxID=3708 RepID=A0ABQ8BP78_BRANA|nr:hypothetical protein HID58_037985 [Brassica napus]
MMVSFVETLKKQEEAVDVVIVSAYLVTFFVFIISFFPYKQRIHDWQLNEFRVAVSDHKTVLCLFLFLCGAITYNDGCAHYETEPVDVVLRFLTKSLWGIFSYVVLFKICVIFRSKPLESTIKTKADEQ